MATYRSLKFKGYPDYRIGDNGRVLSKRKGGFRNHKGGLVKLRRTGVWRDITPTYGNGDYHRVRMSNKDGPRMFKVHHLVLEAFVGPCPKGMEACHFPDRDKTNNRADNLSWGSHKKNMEDMIEHGTSNKNDKHPFVKLTWKRVRKIRRLWRTTSKKTGKLWTMERLGTRYGVTKRAIFDVVHKHRWK